MSDIEITTSDGQTIGAYLAKPDAKPRAGVVVIQEIFGVNEHIRDVCDRLADEGYAAIAPAIFDRLQKGFRSGYSPEEIETARALVANLNIDDCMRDVEAAREKASEFGKVGIVGFCLGGAIAFLGATRLSGMSAASCYYGRLIQQFADETPKCPVQLHYAGEDEAIPPENYEDVRRRRPEAEFYLYEKADHGFNCDKRPSYEPNAAKLAWSRTMELFAANLT
jgi:carboxymethylenebutenolidase